MATVPTLPAILQSPIAINGDKDALPVTTTIPGKMSLDQGFPPECSLEIDDGGVAPSRSDMNQALFIISAWAFYNQSGGVAIYNTTLDYPKPALVFHNNIMYTCDKENGPNVAGVGVKTPGVAGSEIYWLPGIGSITSNLHGNNANSYIKSGIYWIDDAFATFGFPTAGVGGFLSVNAKGTIVDQAMVLRTDSTKLYKRNSTNTGGAWQSWTKALFTNDVRGAAYREIYMSTLVPVNAVGLDGDVHFQYI